MDSGYRMDKIKIDKNEDGTQIAVSGEKEVPIFQKIGFIRVRRPRDQVWKFRKVFSIPEGVVSDQIKAVFNGKESTLRILMPKLIQQVGGTGAKEVKREEIDRASHTSSPPVSDKVPEREKPMNEEPDMKQGYKDLSQQKPGEQVKETAEREHPSKNEQEMKVKPADEVVEQGKKDVEATDDEFWRRSIPHESGEANEAILEKQADESKQNHRKEPELEQGKKDIKGTDEVEGKFPKHEPQEVEEAIFPEKKSSEVGIPSKNEPEMVKEKENIKPTEEEVGRILPQHKGEEIKESMTRPEEELSDPLDKKEVPSNEEIPAQSDELKKVEADQDDAEAYNANEENGGFETHPSPQQGPSAKIQNAYQLKSEQESDTTESLKPDHPEEIQGTGNETQSEIDPVIPPEAPLKNFKLYSPCFLAGSAILISIVIIVIHLSRRSMRR